MEFTLKYGLKALKILIEKTHLCPMPSKPTVPLAWNQPYSSTFSPKNKKGKQRRKALPLDTSGN